MIDQSIHNELRAHYNPDGSDLRWLQMALLDIMVEFDQFMRKNKLSYSITFGTLLGAIRHKGYIPWNDDADIMMTREEWNEFSKFIRPNGYITENIYVFGHVRPELHVEGKGIIDIFIFDYVPSNPILDWYKTGLSIAVVTLIKCKARMLNKAYNRVKPWFVFMPLAALFSMKTLQRWKNKLAILFTPTEMNETDNVRVLNCGPKDMVKKHKYGLLTGDKIDVEFEGYEFKSIPKYDAFLREWYGDYTQLPERPNNLGRVTDESLCDIR